MMECFDMLSAYRAKRARQVETANVAGTAADVPMTPAPVEQILVPFVEDRSAGHSNVGKKQSRPRRLYVDEEGKKHWTVTGKKPMSRKESCKVATVARVHKQAQSKSAVQWEGTRCYLEYMSDATRRRYSML